MPRPDPTRIARQASQAVFGNAGETATLRRYISGTPGANRYGVHDSPNYTEMTITGLFHAGPAGPKFSREMQQAGGQSQTLMLYVTTRETIEPRDEVLWRGSAYRADGHGHPMQIGGFVQWRTPLKLASQ